MKTITIKLFLILTIPFTFSACEIIDEIDDNVSECYATANQIKPPEYIDFIPICQVNWKDGSPAKDLTVKYQIHKEYCSGDTNGFYEVYVPNRLTSDYGYWAPYFTATYKFGNKKDRVMVKYIIAPGAYDWEYDFVFRYEDVDEAHEVNSSGDVIRTIYITLPINADGSS